MHKGTYIQRSVQVTEYLADASIESVPNRTHYVFPLFTKTVSKRLKELPFLNKGVYSTIKLLRSNEICFCVVTWAVGPFVALS